VIGAEVDRAAKVSGDQSLETALDAGLASRDLSSLTPVDGSFARVHVARRDQGPHLLSTDPVHLGVELDEAADIRGVPRTDRALLEAHVSHCRSRTGFLWSCRGARALFQGRICEGKALRRQGSHVLARVPSTDVPAVQETNGSEYSSVHVWSLAQP
jgi:hypothetical protein